MNTVSFGFIYEVTYLIFLSQIVLISFWLSYRWCTARKSFIQAHPHEEYPNLYTVSKDVEHQRIVKRSWMDTLIGLLALADLTNLYFQQASLNLLAQHLLVWGVIQLLPILISNFWCVGHYQRMAQRYPATVRTVSLAPRTINQFFSPLQLATMLLAILMPAALLLLLALSKSTIPEPLFQLVILSVIVTILLTAQVYRILYGKKQDHFVQHDERVKRMAHQLRLFPILLVGFNGFILAQMAISYYQLDSIYVALLSSVLYQSVLLTILLPGITRDYSVYK